VATQFFGPQFGRASATAEAIALQQDGKIVLAGEANIDGGESFALARYNSDGTLDASFGTGGQVTTDFGTLEQGFSFAFPESLALQADGKIVVAGYAFIGQSEDFALVRYNSDGTLDTSFGTGGKLTNDFSGASDMASAVAVQPDGRIVVAGKTARRKFTLVRYDSSGTLDPSFGTGGKVTTDFGLSDSAFSLALQDNGKIVAGGRTFIAGEDFQPALARYNPDGSLDATFGTGGKLIPDFGGSRPLVQPDGKIVTVGSAQINEDTDFALVRYQ